MLDKLKQMLLAEVEALAGFRSLSAIEQEAYLTAFPNSTFAAKEKTAGQTPTHTVWIKPKGEKTATKLSDHVGNDSAKTKAANINKNKNLKVTVKKYKAAASGPIDDSHIKKGALHKQLGIPEDKKIPLSTLEEEKDSPSAKTRKRANFAINERKWKH